MVEEQEKQPSRCILVLGTGRSGTSAVGGVLHNLGVHMGDSFVGRDNTNRWGTFEDAGLRQVNWQITEGSRPPAAYGPLIERRNQRELWGWKDPALVLTLHHALPHLQEIRVIVCNRPAGECIQSGRRAYGWDIVQARGWYNGVKGRLDKWMEVCGCPRLDIEFSDLLDDTKATVKEIAAFAFEGLEQPSRDTIGKAERHIRK